MSERSLRKKLAWWMAELDISWDIELCIKRFDEMKGIHGRVYMTEEKRMACIWLLDPRDTDPDEMRRYDPEVTLVHELVHIMLAPFSKDKVGTHRDIVSEQCVHATSKSLVRMSRAARKGKYRCSTPTRRSLPKPT